MVRRESVTILIISVPHDGYYWELRNLNGELVKGDSGYMVSNPHSPYVSKDDCWMDASFNAQFCLQKVE